MNILNFFTKPRKADLETTRKDIHFLFKSIDLLSERISALEAKVNSAKLIEVPARKRKVVLKDPERETIAKSKMPYYVLAKKFNVSNATIHKIRRDSSRSVDIH